MQQMASRPFATINVALETDDEPPDLIGGNVKVSPTFFLEPSLANPRDLPFCLGRQAGDRQSSVHQQCCCSPSLKWELSHVTHRCSSSR